LTVKWPQNAGKTKIFLEIRHKKGSMTARQSSGVRSSASQPRTRVGFQKPLFLRSVFIISEPAHGLSV
jgi:hypothetical protein